MVSERDSISSSTEDVAVSTTVPNRMVKTEMEAAEALANLSQPVERGGSPGHFGGKMKGNTKRGRRQIKCETPPSPAASYPADSAPSCSDLAQDPAVLFQQQDERNLPNIAKAEQDDQLLDQSQICTADYLSIGGGRSSQNLSEAEKEAKRFRRVLANRESARRTIRRRQALCVELARKSAELTDENEKLKKGKESALREHELLQSTNKNLKSKVEKLGKLEEERTSIIKKARAAKSDIVEHISVLRPSQTEMLTTSPANLPLLLHNAPFAPFMWPTLFQSSSASPSIMHGSQMIQASSNPYPSNEQKTVTNAPPVYILPFSVFLGLPDQVHHCQTSFSQETKIDQLVCSSSSITTTPDGKPDGVEPDVIRVSKGCGLGIKVKFANDLNEIPVESPTLDEAAQSSDAMHEGAMVDHMTDAGSELHLSVSVQVDALSSVPSGFTDVGGVSDQENNHQGSFLPLNSKKKLVDVTAAAEARRRRKELKKLKAIHGNQCRMRC